MDKVKSRQENEGNRRLSEMSNMPNMQSAMANEMTDPYPYDMEYEGEDLSDYDKPPYLNPTQMALTQIIGSAHEGTGTSISSQIQKIIAKELTAPSRRGKVDLQSVPMKEYLENTVIPIVHQGLVALARERPDSPIEYLAAFFLKHKHRYSRDDNENSMFRIRGEAENNQVSPAEPPPPPDPDAAAII